MFLALATRVYVFTVVPPKLIGSSGGLPALGELPGRSWTEKNGTRKMAQIPVIPLNSKNRYARGAVPKKGTNKAHNGLFPKHV